MLTIWVDADACPRAIKSIVIRAAARCQVKVVLVANQALGMVSSPTVSVVQVEKGADVADDYIIEKMKAEDVVITADIPLADRVVTQGSVAISPRGRMYTQESIKEALSIRDFMTHMRDSGVITGGPKPFNDKDKHQFAAALDRLLQQKCKR